MNVDSLRRALDRAEALLFTSVTAEAVVARREAGRTDPADAAHTAELAAEIHAAQADDGSWDGHLIATADALLRLRALAGPVDGAAPAEDDAVRRGLDWLRGRQGAAGRFGEGCTPGWHRLGLCHHFLAGFFAPAQPRLLTKDVLLPSGAHVPGGSAALVAASSLALQAMLRWGRVGADAWLHVDGLQRLVALDPRDAAGLMPLDALPAALRALVDAPATEANRAALEGGLVRLTQIQRADGSWPELDAFYILDVLLSATRAGYGGKGVSAAIERGAGLLAVTQHGDGSWEREVFPRRNLIGWRTLRFALRDIVDEAYREGA